MSLRPRVLIVDDELGVRESLRAVLANDHTVLATDSGEEALRLVTEGSIDLMTLDIRMPGMGGMRILEQAKAIDPDLEVLIITGYGSIDTAVQGLRHQALDYITKPFDAEQVRRLVRRGIDRRAATRQVKSFPDRLLASMSHEMRTPLNVIVGWSTILREESAAHLTREDLLALDRIQVNSTSLLGYVETMCYLADIDRGYVQVALESVDIGALLTKVLEGLVPTVQDKMLTLRVEAPAGLVWQSDPDKLHRLLRALADNAVRFSMQGEIVLRAERQGSNLVFEVRDQGPGIEAEVARDVAAVMEGRAAVRLGFGLRLAARLTQLLDGSMTLTGGARGTTCRIEIPRAPAQRIVCNA